LGAGKTRRLRRVGADVRSRAVLIGWSTGVTNR
jgi:hypothetical protein